MTLRVPAFNLLTFVVMLVSFAVKAQYPGNCKIYQYRGTDSLRRTFVAEEFYEETGDNCSTRTRAGVTKFYRDSLLVRIGRRGNEYHYNSSGQLVCLKRYTSRAHSKSGRRKLKSKTKYFYDESGKLVRTKTVGGAHKETAVLTYDDQNRLNKTSRYIGSYMWNQTQTSYYDGGYQETTIAYDSNGVACYLKELRSKNLGSAFYPHTYLYMVDHNGNVTEESLVNRVGDLVRRETTSYDELNRPLRHTVYNPDGTSAYTEIYVWE